MLKDFKTPDLNAPRYRIRRVQPLNKETYKDFIKKHPEYKDLTFEMYKAIVVNVNGRLWQTAIDYRDGIDLPQSLGTLFIATCKRNKNNVDYKTSQLLGKKLRHRNFESDNHLAKIFYTNFANKYKFKNREVWVFDSARQFKRAVAATYPEKWKQYVMVEPLTKVSEIFKGYAKRDWIYKQTADADLSNYNEFQID